MASLLLCFLVSALALISSPPPALSQSLPPIVNGLSFSFYKSSCPELDSIVRKFLKQQFKKDIGLAAALLRVHFHDCFVQGCDGSVLLDGSASGPSEKNAPPNLTLRPEAFKAINDIRALIDSKCGSVVSCADVLALAARDSVSLSGGPRYKVPLGRRDGLTFATRNATVASLPAPTFNVSAILPVLARINLDAADLVALSGGHTIGRGHCASFSNRIFPSRDPTMDQTFFNNLRGTCPSSNSTNTTVLDIRSPNVFDNKYYVDLMNRQGLFTSDEDLYMDSRTKQTVLDFALNQSLFFEKSSFSMVKMGQLSVLTGGNGEIRTNCSARNGGSISMLPVDEEGETAAY
uniref:Peroxidase n=1 Tax=Doritis pulcherrima x Phalaenopsis hybrid cultivar TaxID=577493 RepID=E4W4Z9_9ASPA|nr:peroxidase [Doritis pulcherrima x Phalaenopsis hybrid cultivar]